VRAWCSPIDHCGRRKPTLSIGQKQNHWLLFTGCLVPLNIVLFLLLPEVRAALVWSLVRCDVSSAAAEETGKTEFRRGEKILKSSASARKPTTSKIAAYFWFVVLGHRKKESLLANDLSVVECVGTNTCH